MSDSAERPPQTPLTPSERSALRARAHILDPVVMVSGKGLNPGVIAEVDRALDSHGLIKIRVLDTGRDERDALISAICDATGAQPVQHIGKILVIFREKPVETDEPSAPAPKRRKPRPYPAERRAAAKAPARTAPDTATPAKQFPSRTRATPGAARKTASRPPIRSGRPGSPARGGRRGR